MKNLKTLVKLQKTKVDEQRIVLLKVQTILDEIIISIENLEKDKKKQEELLHKEPEVGMTYADYLNQYINKKEHLHKKKESTQYAVDLARNQLAELFEEQKRYEIALQKRIDEAKQEEQRKERLYLDEVGSTSFLRKKKERIK